MTSNLIVLIVVALAMGYAPLRRSGDGPQAGARRMVRRGARLMDALTPRALATGPIRGAVDMPTQGVDHRMEALMGKGRPRVIYGHGGTRSRSAALLLKRAGFNEVHDLGSVSGW